MKFVSLIALSSGFVQGTPLREEPPATHAFPAPNAFANWKRWNDIAFTVLKDNLAQTQPPGTWTPQGFDSNTWSWYFTRYNQSTLCANDASNDFIAGHIVKTVFENAETQGSTVYKYWLNETYKLVPKASESSKCSLQDGWSIPQCHNSVWDTENAAWVDYNSNSDLGWTTKNASYNGHTVRTVFDCLLKQVTVEYSTVVAEFGTKPVQYYIGSLKYWRFYDENNFAWFFACPTSKAIQSQLRRRGILYHRNRKPGGNPVWDFGTLEQRDPNSDMTPFAASQIPGFDSSGQTSYTAMYWPQGDAQFVEVEGNICQHMAVSRPGLRHWTARMIELPPVTYPPISDEIKITTGWDGYSRRAWSWEDESFNW